MSSSSTPRLGDYLVVGLVAGTGLAYEILLLRVFSYSQWHHFASLAVSLALLGFGAAGTCLTLMGPRAVRWGDRLFVSGLLIAALGMIAAFLLPHAITVRPLFAVWDWRELLRLIVIDVASFIPFFGLALSLGQVFVRWPGSIARLYAVNLAGSGVGSLAAWGLLSVLFLEGALVLLALLLLLAAGALGVSRAEARRAGFAALTLALCVGGWFGIGLPGLPLSDFKRLSYLLDLPDARVEQEAPDPRAKLTIVRSDSIRIAPGLSLKWTEPVPATDALVLDADKAIPLPRERAAIENWPHRSAMLAHTPFLLRPEGPLAVLGTSEWLTVLHAPEREIVWVENHPKVIGAMRDRDLLANVNPILSGIRPFLQTNQGEFSILFLEVAASELDAATEDYALTVEAISQALEQLQPGGILAIPLHLVQPPRYAPKVMAMVREALGSTRAAPAPKTQTAMLRSMQEGLALVSNRPWTDDDLARIRAFAVERGFDLVYLPGLREDEANRFHQLPEPIYFRAAKAIWAGEGNIPAQAAWRVLQPPTDAQPYFWRSMKWRTLPELLNQLGRPGLIWLDWALLALVVKLLVVAILAGALILLPLRRMARPSGTFTRLTIALYFTALGLGYLLLEMAVFQRSLLYLDHPVLAASVVFVLFTRLWS